MVTVVLLKSIMTCYYIPNPLVDNDINMIKVVIQFNFVEYRNPCNCVGVFFTKVTEQTK